MLFASFAAVLALAQYIPPGGTGGSTTINGVVCASGQSCTLSGWTQLAQTIVSPAGPTISFSSIPATYTDLVVTYNAQSAAGTTADNIVVQFNGDNASHYDAQSLTGQSATPSAGVASPTTVPPIGPIPGSTSGNAAMTGSGEFTLFNYAGTTYWKTGVNKMGLFQNTTGPQITAGVFFVNWRSTAAINAIQLTLASAGNFVAQSKFTLWGVK